MTPLILTDLDDTLFQTMPKCPPGAEGLRQMSSLLDGKPSGFSTLLQQNFLRWLETGAVVPVTARGRDVLARVDIIQAPAICSNGGCILRDDGERDMEWHEQLVAHAGQHHPVAEIYARLTHDLSVERFRHWPVEEEGLDLYIVIKSNASDGAALAHLEKDLAPRVPAGWRCHRNDNNLAYLPPWLGKRQAVRYFVDRIRNRAPDRPIIGIGDSLSDVGFMDLCDFAAMPTRSQLWRQIVSGNIWVE